jgi:hypothetical protein
MAGTNIENEVSQSVLYAGTETTPGAAVTPTFALTGTYESSEDSSLNRQEETTGGYDRYVTPKKSPSTFAGTYGQPLTYRDMAILPRYIIRSGGTGTLVGGSTGAYNYNRSPLFNRYDADSMTVHHGVSGLGLQDTGVRFSEFTVTMDADDEAGAWQWSSNLFLSGRDELPGAFTATTTATTATTLTVTAAGRTVDQYAGAYVFLNPGTHDGQVREIIGNTATDATTGSFTITVAPAFAPVPAAATPIRIEAEFVANITLPFAETIDSYGTRVYVDPVGSIGTNDIAGARVISANVTYSHGLNPKRFLGNSLSQVSSRVGKNSRVVSGQVRLEFDRRDEWLQLRNKTERAIRFEQTGSVIDSGVTHRARIDLPRVVWDTVSPDTRESNNTATFSFIAYKPVGAQAGQPIITVDVINPLATLP